MNFPGELHIEWSIKDNFYSPRSYNDYQTSLKHSAPFSSGSMLAEQIGARVVAAFILLCLGGRRFGQTVFNILRSIVAHSKYCKIPREINRLWTHTYWRLCYTSKRPVYGRLINDPQLISCKICRWDMLSWYSSLALQSPLYSTVFTLGIYPRRIPVLTPSFSF